MLVPTAVTLLLLRTLPLTRCMKYFYLMLLLVASASPAGSQSRQAALSAPEATRVVAGQADTVRAVRMLYGQRRRGGRRYVFGILPRLTILPSIALLLAESNPVGLVATGGAMGLGVSKLTRFSARKETALIEAYQQGRPLPSAIRKKLRAKHFR